ncbi:MAG: S8 family peptidase, partial [Sandaracinaceae bacterium]|nr:S8 family peptidase [Sandaracinaceae bacterium]
DGLRAFPGVEVVSEEPGQLAIVFATDEGRREFENRLRLVQRGQAATRKEVLFAMQGVDAWTPDDRTAVGLRPILDDLRAEPDRRVRVDVELWPLERPSDADRMIATFRERSAAHGVRVLDATRRPVVLLRIEGALAGIEWVLRHRDVRLVDALPRFQLDPALRRLPLSKLEGPTVDANAPVIGVLDSGLVTGHPLLAPAVAHAESFIDGAGPEDEHGHGTHVAGIAVFGDVEEQARAGTFRASARVAAGRVLDGVNEYDEKLIENQIRAAVEVLSRDFGCRIFNVSLGDLHHPHVGGRLRPLAMTLDDLAREHRVLFVVCTGNFRGGSDGPTDWRGEYPGYLVSDGARVLDPAPALNVLTVGSIVRHELSHPAARWPNDPSYQPIARHGQPSPFTRSAAPDTAIKPELVEHGGNLAVDIRAGTSRYVESPTLGVLSTNYAHAGGDLFAVDHGTSFAAPKVANLAARILARYPDASTDLVRALLVAHAEIPAASEALLAKDDLVRVVGYGTPNAQRCLGSSERAVTLVAEDRLGVNESHFFEIPLPEDFTKAPVRRTRRIRIALAHTPIVRPSRADYRASRFTFRVVRAESIEVVRKTFRRGSDEDNLGESGFWPSSSIREAGTVQAATWTIRQTDRRWTRKRPFLVVSRIVPDWGKNLLDSEPYAVVAAIEDRSEAEVRLYSQLRARLRTRARVRVRPARP